MRKMRCSSDEQKTEFLNPPAHYRMNANLHEWPEQTEILMDALQAFGYGGAVTNPSFKNGYTANEENLKRYGRLLNQLRERNLGYWIYDESGYPSGYAGGETLKGHPELEAKGFYMVRRVSYEPRKVEFHLDEESDKIIWAAKYPLDCSEDTASIVKYTEMEEVEFTNKYCACELQKNQVLFIFCVKTAFEGTHCTHDLCANRHYINILNPDAVKRFIELCYEPIVAAEPDAYRYAKAVFTDEPSLMTSYIHGDETWPYALAPWTEDLFEEYEKEYGSSLLPYLPMIFEGRSQTYCIRVRFYQLIGKLVAKAYVRQLADWCNAHGGKFSGHYLAEESMQAHVLFYGSYLEVLKAADYPGVDVLASYPEIYNYNTPKFAQMVVRKNASNGVMAELCPVLDLEHFEQNPIAYARGILNLLYLGGCRCVNSYFFPNFASYAPKELSEYHGYMNQEQASELNAYIGRLGYILEDLQNECSIFVYYALEDVQAKMKPSQSAIETIDSAADRSLNAVTTAIYEGGYDYLFCDREDLTEAVKSLTNGKPQISGMVVKHVIVPAIDIIYESAWQALEALQSAGVTVWFMDKLPRYRAEQMSDFEHYDFREEVVRKELRQQGAFEAKSETQVLDGLANERWEFHVSAANQKPGMLLKAAYKNEEQLFYFVVNNTLAATSVNWEWDQVEQVEIWDPMSGKIHTCASGQSVEIGPYQGVLIVKQR